MPFSLFSIIAIIFAAPVAVAAADYSIRLLRHLRRLA